MAESISIAGFLDFLKTNGKYYYMHDLELRNLIDASGPDSINGVYEENIFPIFAENKFYKKVGDTYVLLETKPTDWNEQYSKYYFLNKTGISSNRDILSTSYVIFNALRKKLDIDSFEEFMNDFHNFENMFASVAFSGSFNDLVDVPEFSNVAFSGSFNDLVDVPSSGLGAHVEDTDLVFSGPSYGGMTAQEDENLADLIGSGIIP